MDCVIRAKWYETERNFHDVLDFSTLDVVSEVLPTEEVLPTGGLERVSEKEFRWLRTCPTGTSTVFMIVRR